MSKGANDGDKEERVTLNTNSRVASKEQLQFEDECKVDYESDAIKGAPDLISRPSDKPSRQNQIYVQRVSKLSNKRKQKLQDELDKILSQEFFKMNNEVQNINKHLSGNVDQNLIDLNKVVLMTETESVISQSNFKDDMFRDEQDPLPSTLRQNQGQKPQISQIPDKKGSLEEQLMNNTQGQKFLNEQYQIQQQIELEKYKRLNASSSRNLLEERKDQKLYNEVEANKKISSMQIQTKTMTYTNNIQQPPQKITQINGQSSEEDIRKVDDIQLTPILKDEEKNQKNEKQKESYNKISDEEGKIKTKPSESNEKTDPLQSQENTKKVIEKEEKKEESKGISKSEHKKGKGGEKAKKQQNCSSCCSIY